MIKYLGGLALPKELSEVTVLVGNRNEAMDNMIKYFGGIENAFNVLTQMYGIGYSRKYWYKEGNLVIALEDGVAPRDLESAIQHELAKKVQREHHYNTVQFRSPEQLPDRIIETVGREFGSGIKKSPKLILRYLHNGKTYYVTGCMSHYSYKREPEFRLDGHNGDWHGYVTGWAYCE